MGILSNSGGLIKDLGTILAIANGGSGVAGNRTVVSDANYQALVTDRTIAMRTLTAPRIITLPAASAFPPGVDLTIVDESGSLTATNTLTIQRAGTTDSFRMNGGTTVVTLTVPYSSLTIASDGVSQWCAVAPYQAYINSMILAYLKTIGTNTSYGDNLGQTTGSFQIGNVVFKYFRDTPALNRTWTFATAFPNYCVFATGAPYSGGATNTLYGVPNITVIGQSAVQYQCRTGIISGSVSVASTEQADSATQYIMFALGY